jgi:hypothetical protein
LDGSLHALFKITLAFEPSGHGTGAQLIEELHGFVYLILALCFFGRLRRLPLIEVMGPQLKHSRA